MSAITSIRTRFILMFGASCLAFGIGANAQSQSAAPQDADASKTISLGEVARQQRTGAHPKAKRIVTDEDIVPSEGAAPPSRMETPVAAPDQKETDKKATPEEKERERAKPFIEAVEAQKKRIATAQKKIQDLRSEQRQRASAQYSDMGLLLRDPQKWNNDEKAVQEEVAKHQQEIDDAKAQLEEARERARKNGVRLPD